jgi:hypothetical protein
MRTLDESRPAESQDAEAESPRRSAAAVQRVRLGEELPIFCEKCGYSLHGLPQVRCERCNVLHYACPECNHHQPINTLRPAVQKILGRIRAFALGLWVLIKLNYFGWRLLAWGARGAAWSYAWGYSRGGGGPSPLQARDLDAPAFMAFAMFGFSYGVVSRMLLLRWRSSVLVGLVLAAVVSAAVMTGGYLRWLDASSWRPGAPTPIHTDLLLLVGWGACVIVLGAAIVWPIWLSMVYLFLPRKTAAALLEWQRGLSAREPGLVRA